MRGRICRRRRAFTSTAWCWALRALLIFAAALLAGLLPAISSTGKAVFATLQASSRTVGGSLSRTALRKTLLTVEIAITVVLLIAAGLLLKSFMRLRTTDVGCATDNVLTMSYSLPVLKYDKPEKINAFNEALLARLRAIPGVRAAALGSTLPGDSWGNDDIFTIPDSPTGDSRTKTCPTPLSARPIRDYFTALGDSSDRGALLHRPGSAGPRRTR